MPRITTDDGIGLHVEETGEGTPVIFVHEFAGDARSFEPQVRYLARRYRCITFNARGFPPSDVPDTVEAYSQARARDDIKAVLDGLGIDRTHVVGLSMGGFATLHFGFTYSERVRSLVIAGCGYGAEPSRREQFAREAERAAERFTALPMAEAARSYALGPTRVQFQNKDPRGWAEFEEQLAEHSPRGSALTLLGVQRARPSLFELEAALRSITAPTLILTGDEDWPCLEPALFMKRTIKSAGLAVLPNTGHAANLEEPAAFNALLTDFLHAVDLGRWPTRDPRSTSDDILGTR